MKVKVRELYGRLWLGLNLISEGHTVVIGHQSGILSGAMHEIQPDIYLAKSARAKRQLIYNKLSDANCSLVVQDPEGGAFFDTGEVVSHYPEKRIDEEMLDLFDGILAWGKKSEQGIREQTSFPTEQIYTTGSPRFDLLHPDLRELYSTRARELKEKFGDYILVNTNFSNANNIRKRRREKLQENLDDESLQHELILLLKFIEVIKTLSEQAEQQTIIIRPHPAEALDFYKGHFENNPSVVIERSGGVRPWIMGAEVVIHNNCTTGLESLLLQTPVVSYEPRVEIGTASTTHLSSKVSKSVTTVEKLLSEIQTVAQSSQPSKLGAEQSTVLEQYITNIEERAAPQIVAALEEITDKTNPTSYPTSPLSQKVKTKVKKHPVAPKAQQLRNTIQSVRDTKNKNSEQIVSDKKFERLGVTEIQSGLSQLQTISGIDGFDVKITKINELYDIYRLEQS